MYKLTIDQLILRYYFMMAIVIGSFYFGIPWLSILAFPILLSALAGWKRNTML
ncbi:MAG: hypothetical protein IT267_11275 [Saprospiraceae bacterium]|nr:hypothetical protein [Saprospiraceae bacterium]